MSPQPERRFTISDAMILVAAAAVGMILVRSYLPGFIRQISTLDRQIADRWGLWGAYGWLQGPVACFVIPFMTGLVAMRLLPPRPPRRRLVSQPGFVACVAVLASLMPGLRWYGINRHQPGFQREVSFEVTWYVVTHWAPHAVVGAWIALVFARRFRPEPSWIDRLGRLLGGYWVLVAVGLYALLTLQWLTDVFSRG